MPALDALFELQTLDTSIDRLKHERRTLPQRDELVRIARTIAAAETEAKPALAELQVLRSDEDALDVRATEFATKATDIEAKMYSGEITSPKELQAMQAEVDHLRAAASGVEDEELELMERETAINATIEAALAPIGPLEVQRAELESVVATEEQRIDSELANLSGQRDAFAAQIAEDDLHIYEKCRAASHGIGIAKLANGGCGGCHLSIPTSEVERIRHLPEGAYEFCDNCGCMLVAG